MEGIGIVIFLIWVTWKFLAFISGELGKVVKSSGPIGPAPPPPDDGGTELEDVPYDHLDELPPHYFEEEPLEEPPVLFVEQAEEEPAAPEPEEERPRPVPALDLPPPGLRRRVPRRIPDLKGAVIWSEILAPPVALRKEDTREL